MRPAGVSVDHSTVNCWVIKDSPQLEEAFHRHKQLGSLGCTWMRHTIVYLDDGGIYRAVDKHGHSIDSLLTSHRGEQIAPDFLVKALRRYGVPKAITINPSEVTSAAIWGYNEAHGMAIIIRQVKYRNNIVEQNHCGMKQVACPLSEFKSFEASQPTLVGIELRHTPKKGQVGGENGTEGFTPTEQVYSLAASSPAQ